MKSKIVYIVFLLWLMLPLQAQVIERHGEYYTMNGEEFISSTAFCGYLRNSNPKLFAEYNRGYRIAMSGWGLFSFGVVATPVSAVMMLMNQDRTEIDPATGQTIVHKASDAWFCGWVTCLAIASVSLCVSFPLLGVGYHRMHQSIDAHNAAQTNALQAYWSLEIKTGGVGLAYHF